MSDHLDPSQANSGEDTRLARTGIMFFLAGAGGAAAFAAIIVLLRPFWIDIDWFLNDKLHRTLPWTVMILCVTIGLTACFALIAAKEIRGLRNPASRRMSAAFWLFPVAAVLILTALFGILLRQMKHEMNVFEYQMVHWLPYAAIAVFCFLFIVVLPYFSLWRRAAIRWTLFAVIGVLMAVVIADPFAPRIVAGPWLQLAENGGLSVSWKTNCPATGWIEYGEGFSKRAHASQYGLIDANTQVHRVTLEGLEPGARVPYRIVSKKIRSIYPSSVRFGGAVTSPAYTARVPDTRAEEVTFLMICDLHENRRILPELLEAGGVESCSFVVFNGDSLNYVESEYQLLTRFLQPLSNTFATAIPFVFVRGNHETRGAFARNLPDYVHLPGHPYVSAFKMGPAEFLVLDTGEDKPDDHIEYSGLVDFNTWRAQETRILDTLLAAPEWSQASFRLLLAHIPFDTPEWRRKFTQAGLDLQFAGHVHTTKFCPSPGEYPTLIFGGQVWSQPEKFPIARVTVTPRLVSVDAITRGGLKAGHWEIPAREPRP